VLDLTKVKGDVMVKNNADAPYPDGDPDTLVDEFTGTLMKITLPIFRMERLRLINQAFNERRNKVRAE